jgi:GTP pyrophosphokinase
MTALTSSYADALQFMVDRHGHMVRKVSGVPFCAHLMSVSTLVLEHGGDETAAIAALLHDTIEDAGGVEAEAEITRRFGSEVARIVRDVSDADTVPKPPWRERKLAYIEHLATVDEQALLVSAADKLHNVRTLVDDYHQVGEGLWENFNAPKEDQLWVYDAYTAAFERRLAALGVTNGRLYDLVQLLRSTFDEFAASVS